VVVASQFGEYAIGVGLYFMTQVPNLASNLNIVQNNRYSAGSFSASVLVRSPAWLCPQPLI
jgi:hypothetical protein